MESSRQTRRDETSQNLTPCCSNRCWFYKITYGHFSTKCSSFLLWENSFDNNRLIYQFTKSQSYEGEFGLSCTAEYFMRDKLSWYLAFSSLGICQFTWNIERIWTKLGLVKRVCIITWHRLFNYSELFNSIFWICILIAKS